MLLGLIPVGIKLRSEVLHLVLECSGRTDRVLLQEWLWWGGGGGGGGRGGWVDNYLASPWVPMRIPNLD